MIEEIKLPENTEETEELEIKYNWKVVDDEGTTLEEFRYKEAAVTWIRNNRWSMYGELKIEKIK